MGRRTSVINQIRGLLLERGITIRKGRRHAEAALPQILEDADTNLSGRLRMLLAQLQRELGQLQSQIEEIDAVIVQVAGEHEACQRLMAIPGIGPVTATAIVSAIGNGADSKRGRGFSAWLGLVPGQYSTGGKQKLLGISKCGNGYLRRLLVNGARAVLQCREKQSSGLRAWLGKLVSRAHSNVAAWPWPTNWPAWHGRCWPEEKPIGLGCWRPKQWQYDAHGLQLPPGEQPQAWKSHARFPQSQTKGDG